MFSRWYLFNFPLLTFSFLSRGYTQFHSNSSEIWERKKERVCFERLESHKFIGIFWCDFDLVSQEVCFLGNLRDEIWKSLYFRLHYTGQHIVDVLSVCGHFWMEELMWLPKPWDERERWKIESVSEWIRRREGESVRLTGECVLEEEWMTDIVFLLGFEIIGYFNLPSNRTMYVSSSFIFSFEWICLYFLSSSFSWSVFHINLYEHVAV